MNQIRKLIFRMLTFIALHIFLFQTTISFPSDILFRREQISTEIVETLVFNFDEDDSDEQKNEINGKDDVNLYQKDFSKILMKFQKQIHGNLHELVELNRITNQQNNTNFENNIINFHQREKIEENNQSKQEEVLEKTNSSSPEEQIDFDVDAVTWRIVTHTEPKIDYDYDQFKSEYEQYQAELNKTGKLNITEFRPVSMSECNADKWYNIGPFTAKCLFKEMNEGPTEKIREEAKASLSFITKFWGWVLIAFIVLGCGHCGFCNSFCAIVCPCPFCRVDDEYEQLKQDLALDPPGRITMGINKKRDVNSKSTLDQKTYVPSETETYLYKKMWRTIYRT